MAKKIKNPSRLWRCPNCKKRPSVEQLVCNGTPAAGPCGFDRLNPQHLSRFKVGEKGLSMTAEYITVHRNPVHVDIKVKDKEREKLEAPKKVAKKKAPKKTKKVTKKTIKKEIESTNIVEEVTAPSIETE